MYGLWLFKEIETEYGYCKVEIYRRGYNGSQIEIGALSADSLNISLENMSSITDPIGKSVCSFSIIDTGQINYEDFFTPDATAFKVVVSTKVGEGTYVTRWSGYVTPDFFAENLSYRTPISLTARDNIGYLNDVDFDLDAATVTIRQLIQTAFAKISDNYPMNLAFVSQKQTAEGVLAIDATISTALLREMSWYEAVETILHDLGLQMRWVDNNTIAVIDVSQIPEYYATQGFNFIGASGYREILPAWRQLSQSQDYGLIENFFEGWLREDNISYVKTIVMRPPNATDWTTDIAYYVPNNWGVARDIYTISPQYYGAKFGKKIYFTGVSEEYPTTTYLSWRQQIQSSITPIKIAFNAFNSVLYPSEKYSNVNTPSMRRLVAYNPKDAFHGEKKGEFLQIGLKMNILLHSGLKSYVLRDNWVDIESAGDWQLNFTLPKVELSYVEGGQATATEPTEQEVTINVATIPYDGEIELRIYGWYIVDKHNYWEDDWTLTDYQFDWLKCLSYINEPIFSYNNDEPATGQDASILVNSLHNVKNSQDYIFGEVPLDNGGVNAYAGGLYKADGNELVGFQRNAEGVNYNLLELVGREAIHFNKKNYNKLSGQIKNLDKEPLMFNRLFVREGKTYAPFAYSLNVISNEMNITTMQEVEPYETASFSEIHSEVTTGGATVGGGNNTVLQYSEDAGNAKRVFELNAANADEKEDAYLIIDNANFSEAKKVHISEVKDTQLRAEVEDLRADFDNLNNLLNDDTSGVIDTWNEVVDFLEGYKESEDLASILSGINAAIADRALKTDLDAVDKRVQTLEALGLTLEVKDGVTYVKSKYSFYTLGGLASGEPSSSGGGGGTAGGSNVSFKAELLSGTKIGTITIDNVATNIYVPSALANPYALTINGTTYDGSSPVDITISGGSGGFNGGTITGKTTISTSGWGNQLVINRSEGNGASAVAFSNAGNGILGYIGIGGTASLVGTKPFYEDASGNTYSLLHSGNYSSYALPLSGGVLSGDNNVLTINGINNSYILFNLNKSACASVGYYNNLAYVASEIGGYARIGIADNGEPQYWPDYTGNTRHTLIHSGNIGSYKAGDSARLGGIDANRYMVGHSLYAVDADYIFDLTYHSVANGSHLPSNSQYGSLLTMPYRKPTGNSTPDFGTQIYIPNGDDSKPYMWFRTSLRNTWNSWRKVVSEDVYGDVSITRNLFASGGVTSGQASDRRLKENICTISTTDAVSVLRKLNPIFFKWNALATSLDSRNTGDSVGFIADEYEGLIVNSGRDIWEKYRAIDYTKAIPYLAKGWQINADNIEDLRTRVEVLEKENRELKQRLNMRA